MTASGVSSRRKVTGGREGGGPLGEDATDPSKGGGYKSEPITETSYLQTFIEQYIRRKNFVKFINFKFIKDCFLKEI